MATVDCDAIITRLREVLVDNAGSVRTVGSGRFRGNIFEALEANAKSLRAMSKPRVEPRIAAMRRHPSSPSVLGTVALYELDVEVLVVRQLDGHHRLADSARDDVSALAANDADVIAQAITWPGNLTQTSGSVATNLVSGCLVYSGESECSGPLFEDGEKSGRIETLHRFRGVVRVTTAVS